MEELTRRGHEVSAVDLPLTSLDDDAETVRRVLDDLDGPAVLVGHSYGGAVITQASADLDNVTALVYLAAFGIDEGESVAGVQAPFPPSLLGTTVSPTPYDAPDPA